MVLKGPRLLLINPWVIDFASYDFWIKPIGLLILASILRLNGYRISLLDCMDRGHLKLLQYQGIRRPLNRWDGTGHFNKESIPKPAVLKDIPRQYSRYGIPRFLVKKILEQMSPPQMILVTSGMTYWYPGIIEMISLLRETFPGVKIILGGIYATLCSEHARQFSGADRVVMGPGENRILKIANEITGWNTDYKFIQGINDYPIPAYDFYDQLNSVAILTSRGCPYRCPFCASHLLSPQFEQKEPRKVIEELQFLSNRFKIRHVAFYDDALLINKKTHIIPILHGILDKELNLNFHLPNGIHPGLVDSHLAMLMYQAGFKTIRLSFETSNPERQRTMGMKVCNEDLVHAVDYFLEAGYHRNELASYVMFGLPGQSMEEVIESMEFVLDLGIKINLASFSPIPDTPYWKEVFLNEELSSDPDPLLTNNSIFPVKSNEFTYNDFMQISTLSKVINRIIDQKEKNK